MDLALRLAREYTNTLPLVPADWAFLGSYVSDETRWGTRGELNALGEDVLTATFDGEGAISSSLPCPHVLRGP